MTEQISLIAVYDRIAAVDTKVEALVARMGERLDSGSRKLDDHEARIRILEAVREQGRGKSGVLTFIASLAGSSTASAIIAYMLSRH